MDFLRTISPLLQKWLIVFKSLRSVSLDIFTTLSPSSHSRGPYLYGVIVSILFFMDLFIAAVLAKLGLIFAIQLRHLFCVYLRENADRHSTLALSLFPAGDVLLWTPFDGLFAVMKFEMVLF